MLAFDPTYPLLVCHETDSHSFLTDHSRLKLIANFKGLSIFQILNCLDFEASITPRVGFNLKRYLDRFYLWTCEEDSARRQEVLDSFFELISKDYESLVDIERNIENIRNLLDYLTRLVKPFERSRIIDYGCGTGLSLRVAHPFEFELIGVDRCPTMREIATSRGMEVWSPGQLAQQPKNSVDGAFASYLFHLLPATNGLQLLWSRIRPDGVLVGNFHKDEGLQLIDECIIELNGEILPLSVPSENQHHGAYRAYRKR